MIIIINNEIYINTEIENSIEIEESKNNNLETYEVEKLDVFTNNFEELNINGNLFNKSNNNNIIEEAKYKEEQKDLIVKEINNNILNLNNFDSKKNKKFK